MAKISRKSIKINNDIFKLENGYYIGTITGVKDIVSKNGSSFTIDLEDVDDRKKFVCWFSYEYQYQWLDIIDELNIEDTRDFLGLRIKFLVENSWNLNGDNYSNVVEVMLADDTAKM